MARRGRSDGISKLGLMALAAGLTSTRFGGEDPLGTAPDGDNWHHEGLSRRAAKASGWSPEAENALAFHTDYVDSYLYNPLWWLNFAQGGGMKRLKVVMSSQADLVKVHFDDLFDTESVLATWRRYLSGTVAGLLWIANEDVATEQKVSMAHNIVGVSLHAVQDYYSHSNWINDPARRNRTFFSTPDSIRRSSELWTGAYETPERFGVKHHGEYLFACTVLNQIGSVGRAMMRVVCHAASPFSKSAVCDWFKQCQEAEPINPDEIAGFELNPANGVLWMKPGINVDSSWQASMGVRERGLESGFDGADGFRTAYNLAYQSSCQWLHLLEHIMDDAGHGDLWNAVKNQGITRDDYLTDLDPFEKFNQLPYRFISTGPYPPSPKVDDTDKWYVRLTVATADEKNAGTNADIVPIIDGKRFPALDHAPQPPRPEPGEDPERGVARSALGIDDHERGDVRSYMVGPLDQAPKRIELLNDAPTFGDLIVAAAEAVWDAVVWAFESVVDFLLSLIGYHADFVDEGHTAVAAADLEALDPGDRHEWSIRCNGGSEGDYRINGWVEATGTETVSPTGVPLRRYEVYFDELHCIEESDWDRGTWSDEPFVLGLVMGHGAGNSLIKWKTSPYRNVDSGDTRSINREYTVDVPRNYGFISVAVAVYESDSESGSDREDLLNEFADNMTSAIGESEDGFAVLLSESIASGWKLDWFEAAAFRRGETVEVRSYAREHFNQWLDGGEHTGRDLDLANTQLAEVPDEFACSCRSLLIPDIDPPRIPLLPPIELPPRLKDRLREKIDAALGKDKSAD